MHFEQNFKPEFMCLHGERVALIRCEAGGNEQHCIGTYNAGLQKLIFVDDEVFTQDRDVDQRACCTDVTQSSAEELFIREDGEGGSSGSFISRRNEIGLCAFLDPALGRERRLNSAMMPDEEFASACFMLRTGVMPEAPVPTVSCIMAAACSCN